MNMHADAHTHTHIHSYASFQKGESDDIDDRS